VEALDEGVVQHEHDTGEPPGPFLVPEENLTDIANVFNFGMANAEFPANNVNARKPAAPS
jgi:hypothetical protein